MNKSKKISNKKISQIISILIVVIAIIKIVCSRNGIFYNNDIQKNDIQNNNILNIIDTQKGIQNKDNSIVFNNTISNFNDINSIEEYTNQIYVEVNNNKPYFKEEDYTTEAFEKYSELDKYGRCGTAYANICKEIMPPNGDKRGDIFAVKPTGWKQAKYNGEYLYNRCHLIGYQLSDEDANELNLITGTRYFNVSGMLPFENEVANFIRDNEKDVHILYRVTPIFKGNNALASGVEIEAYSVEDNGKGICFNVYIYNIQPGINIDYSTGESYEVTIQP